MQVDSSKTYIGVVEINLDPKRLGRCRIRVVDIFDDIPTDDIPWASPWKDINGNEFNVPEVGKVVTCVFDSGNIYKPEYIYSDHYNMNLENKLKDLSDQGYKSMKSVLFDHKTQIYSNDDQGLIVDYKFHNINIQDTSIDINLKDNYSKLSLGDAEADQQVILGTNFMEWMDKFVKQLAGLSNGPYMGNQGAPVQPAPSFVEVLDEYFKLRDPKFLSNNVYVNSNSKIKTVSNKSKDRKSVQVTGDDWKSTKKVSEISMEMDDDVPSYVPLIDDNDDANVTSDRTNNKIKSSPVYVDPSVGPSSGVLSDFAKKLVEVALTQEGVTEDPKNSNTGTDVYIYQDSTGLAPPKIPGPGWPWCAAFVCFCFKAVANMGDVRYSFTLPKTAGAYDFENWARKNSKYIDVIKPPFDKILPGDVVIFNFSHIGISLSEIKNNKISTIEGNTNQKGSREGDGVYKKTRRLSLIRSVLRIKYDETQVEFLPKDQIV